MVRKFDERIVRFKENPFNGYGQLNVIDVLTEEEMHGKNRVFAHITLSVGSAAALHEHHGEGEVYYILSGEGLFNDNGTEVPVSAGDVTFSGFNGSHGIKNTGKVPLEYIALVVYE